jgi:hypothetical protein
MVLGGEGGMELNDYVDVAGVATVLKFRREFLRSGGSDGHQSEYDNDERGFGSHSDFFLLLQPCICNWRTNWAATRSD